MTSTKNRKAINTQKQGVVMASASAERLLHVIETQGRASRRMAMKHLRAMIRNTGGKL